MTITGKDQLNSIIFYDRMETDAQMCSYAKEMEEDPKEHMDMTVRKRLIGEEIIHYGLEDKGITSLWLDTDEKWQKNVSILQENNNREKRCQAHNRLQKGYQFSKEQVFVLILNQRIGQYISQVPLPKRPGLEAEEVNICQVSDSAYFEETIKEMTQHIVQDNLNERDVKAISRTLVETASDPVITLSHLFRL
ncbi:hypothetical protein C1645_822419 [Glomus cerebriforme]|uniref:Uncharacterized protein n=1 Tax=Glomus cerebriforme TaxID=658196 RepID=A0A397T4F2_9GLOM|nr:hypothetical protein C1645_822419 [Glomus cerebriforme]